jgi:flagellar biosynthesis chaperone FliJ
MRVSSKPRANLSRRVSDSCGAPRSPSRSRFTLKAIRGGAEKYLVKPKTRLDPVVRLREQQEQLSLRALADCTRRLESAENHLRDRRANASSDQRGTAPASHWLLTELSHTRALSDVRQAENAVKLATEASSASRESYATAHSSAEAMRKITALRVGEILQLQEVKERREMDELSILRRRSAEAA